MTHESLGSDRCISKDVDAQLVMSEQTHLISATFCADVGIGKWQKDPFMPRNLHVLGSQTSQLKICKNFFCHFPFYDWSKHDTVMKGAC